MLYTSRIEDPLYLLYALAFTVYDSMRADNTVACADKRYGSPVDRNGPCKTLYTVRAGARLFTLQPSQPPSAVGYRVDPMGNGPRHTVL